MDSLEYIKDEIPTQSLISCYLGINKFLIDFNSFEHVKGYHITGKLYMGFTNCIT